MKEYKKGDRVWFDCSKADWYIPGKTSPLKCGIFKWYNYLLDGTRRLILDVGLGLTMAVPEEDVRDIEEDFYWEPDEIKSNYISVPARHNGKTYMAMAKAVQEGFQLGISNWVNESNHVFEVGEFAKIIKGDSLFRGLVVKIVDVRYDQKKGKHRYWAKVWPDQMPVCYEQGELEVTNERPKDWEEKEMKCENVEIKVDDTVFYKSKLKVGMLVVTRDETRYLVMPTSWGGLGLSNMNTAITLNNYTENMEYFKDHHKDIVKVYDVAVETRNVQDLFNTNAKYKSVLGIEYPLRNLIWERNEARELTLTQIEKLLGYKIKVVK